LEFYLNGSFLKQSGGGISVSDRGFLFGDGVYEVIRAVNGRLFKPEEHMQRLDRSLAGLHIQTDSMEKKRLTEIGRELLQRNSLLEEEAVVYIQITRGSAWPRTHTFPDPEVDPTVVVTTTPYSPKTTLHREGISVITLTDERWARCNLKTVNLLPNVLARQQATEADADSALLVRDGVLTESPNANIIGIKNHTLYTYPSSNYILDGVTREIVIEMADELDLPVRFVPIQEEELFDLDELFLSGTTTDIQPVVQVNSRPLGSGKPGPVVRQFQQAYRKLLYG